MAKTSRNIIKTWFETGDFPTQDQFWSWLDSFWHKDDKLPTSQITGLDDLIAGKATTEQITNLQNQIDQINNGPTSQTLNENTAYEIPAGKLLEKITVKSTGDLDAFGIGIGNGGYDIIPSMPVASGSIELFTLNIPAEEDASKTIWFNGITAQTKIKIYLQ